MRYSVGTDVRRVRAPRYHDLLPQRNPDQGTRRTGFAAVWLGGHYLSDEAPPTDAHVSLGSMHRAKGLEFKVVIVMGCDEDMLSRASVLSELVDEADRVVFIEQERQLLYVACTRARERLLVTYSGKPSRFFKTFT